MIKLNQSAFKEHQASSFAKAQSPQHKKGLRLVSGDVATDMLANSAKATNGS